MSCPNRGCLRGQTARWLSSWRPGIGGPLPATSRIGEGTIGESCPPQTIIWSVTSMRVNTAECAARAVGASTIEIGDQLSAKTTTPH